MKKDQYIALCADSAADAECLESAAVLINYRIDRTVSFIFIGIPVTELLDDDYPIFIRQAGV